MKWWKYKIRVSIKIFTIQGYFKSKWILILIIPSSFVAHCFANEHCNIFEVFEV